MRHLAILGLAILGLAIGPRDGLAEPRSAWVQFAPDNQVSIRAITGEPACPMVEVDGHARPMTERAGPDADFPIRTCALTLDRRPHVAKLDGRTLPLPGRAIRRIVIFGDTGCRLKGKDIQGCNDPVAWPFALVARQAAAQHPDLVIHVGDYHYRETACPAGVAACAGTPVGDNWPVWAADFFDPAKPLLDAAPWIFIRGNHEICGRGGKGWFRYLDAAPDVLPCPDFTLPYAIRLDDHLSFAVLDSASAEDSTAPPALVARYTQAFEAVTAHLRGPYWLLTHRPVWGVAQNADGSLVSVDRTEQAAIDPRVPAGLEMVVSGHIHTFASFAFGATRPGQLVAGVGGSLYDQVHLPADGVFQVDGRQPAKSFALTDYGYLVLDRTPHGWAGTFRHAGDDRVLATCTIQGRDIACQ